MLPRRPLYDSVREGPRGHQAIDSGPGFPNRVLETEAFTCLPGIAVVASIWDAASGLQHFREVHAVARHDRRVALREVVVEIGTAAIVILIAV